MYWNHRLLRKVDGKGTPYEETNLYIVEVFYKDFRYEGPESIMGWTEKEVGVYGENVDEIRQTLEWMLLALDKPILDEETMLSERGL